MSAASFQIGPLTTVIAPGELEAWLAAAEPGDRLVYASGIAAPKNDATFAKARELYDERLVTLNVARREDRRGSDWIVQRRGALANAQAVAPLVAITDEDEPEDQAVLRIVRRCIKHGLPMRTDAEIARELSLTGKDRANYLLKKLRNAGTIVIAGRGPRDRRVVTDVASGRSTIEGAL